MQTRPSHILPVIVISQFAGTSLWFAGNAVLPELINEFRLSTYALSNITSAVMIGFIAGTLVFSVFSLPDRVSPVKLFFISSVCGAVANVSVIWLARDEKSLYLLRLLTGFCIAGIYPVGMKIASDWYEKGLGKAMGLLLGALVLGTAFPHLLKNREFSLPWKTVLYCTSGFAIVGGFLMLLFAGDGPFRRKSGAFKWNAIGQIFASKKWRQAAFGYFGHMWELYSFWGFLPVMLVLYAQKNKTDIDVPFYSFLVIASGCISSIAGGYLSQKFGSARIATYALLISGICCFVSPLFYQLPFSLFLLLLFTWGLSVVPDSPQFSTLVAQYAPENLRGTALTIYNSIGFTITTLSLLLMDRLYYSSSFFAKENSFLLLGIGALIGIPGMYRLIRSAG